MLILPMNKKVVGIACFMIIAATACTNIKTNFGEFAQYKVKSTAVKEYSRDEIWQLTNMNLGVVTADYCKSEIMQSLPSKSALKSQLKAKVHDVGGNALVFDACTVRTAFMGCDSFMECKGTAYDVPDNDRLR